MSVASFVKKKRRRGQHVCDVQEIGREQAFFGRLLNHKMATTTQRTCSHQQKEKEKKILKKEKTHEMQGSNIVQIQICHNAKQNIIRQRVEGHPLSQFRCCRRSRSRSRWLLMSRVGCRYCRRMGMVVVVVVAVVGDRARARACACVSVRGFDGDGGDGDMKEWNGESGRWGLSVYIQRLFVVVTVD